MKTVIIQILLFWFGCGILNFVTLVLHDFFIHGEGFTEEDKDLFLDCAACGVWGLYRSLRIYVLFYVFGYSMDEIEEEDES